MTAPQTWRTVQKSEPSRGPPVVRPHSWSYLLSQDLSSLEVLLHPLLSQNPEHKAFKSQISRTLFFTESQVYFYSNESALCLGTSPHLSKIVTQVLCRVSRRAADFWAVCLLFPGMRNRSDQVLEVWNNVEKTRRCKEHGMFQGQGGKINWRENALWEENDNQGLSSRGA